MSHESPEPARSRLADVADLAGVSTATVSRVLNERANVARGTREAVRAALEQLGYEHPLRARPRAPGLVGLVVPELVNPVFPAFVQEIGRHLSHAGYTPLLCTQTPGGASEDEHVESLLHHGVHGIVVVSGLHADTREEPARYVRLRGRGTPLVLVGGHVPGVDVPFVSADDHLAAELAVRHLVALGHRRIGLATGPERFVPTRRRREGFVRALCAHGLADDPAQAARSYCVTTLFTAEGGQVAGAELLARGTTAIVCGSDLMALGVVRAARDRGMDVPGDVSVTGYDDSPLVAFTDPPLTTVRQPVAAMARAAVTALLVEIGGERAPRTELLFQPELVVRSSTGAAPAR